LSGHIRGLDVPAAEVELDHGYESLYRVFDLGHGEESFRVGHEAVRLLVAYIAALFEHVELTL
jgi:hypothetical protein